MPNGPLMSGAVDHGAGNAVQATASGSNEGNGAVEESRKRHRTHQRPIYSVRRGLGTFFRETLDYEIGKEAALKYRRKCARQERRRANIADPAAVHAPVHPPSGRVPSAAQPADRVRQPRIDGPASAPVSQQTGTPAVRGTAKPTLLERLLQKSRHRDRNQAAMVGAEPRMLVR
jgi:hypothetical protein